MVCYVSVESLSLKFHNSAQPCVDDQNARELRLFMLWFVLVRSSFALLHTFQSFCYPIASRDRSTPITHPRFLGSTNKACREEEKSNGQVVRLSEFCNNNEKSLQ